MTAGGEERNLTHLQLLFNITTPVVDIWSERKAGYGFLAMCLNRKKKKKKKHYKYEMSKRQQGLKTWLQACMHRKVEYIDLFSSTRVLYKLPSYHEGGGGEGRRGRRQSSSRAHNVHKHSPKKNKKKKPNPHAAVWCTSRSSVGSRQNPFRKKGTIPSSTVTQRATKDSRGELTG